MVAGSIPARPTKKSPGFFAKKQNPGRFLFYSQSPTGSHLKFFTFSDARFPRTCPSKTCWAMSMYRNPGWYQPRWLLAGIVLIVLPALLLSYYGLRLFLLNRQETARTAAVQRSLSEEFPRWRQAVDACVAQGAGQWIDPAEARELVRRQKILQEKYLYLTVDSLIARRNVQQDSVIYAYDYQQVRIHQRVLPRGATLWDGQYVVNNKQEFLGMTHNQTGYLLMLQSAMQLLEQERQNGHNHTFFNGNLAINDAIINQRYSIVGLDGSGKYLIQLSSRAPDAGYAGDNNKIAVPQSLYLLFGDFVRSGWLVLLATFTTIGLYIYVLRLSRQSHRWLSSLNKATCAIAITDRQGNFNYVNRAFQDWNEGQAVGDKNLRELSQHPQMENIIRKVQEHPGHTEYFYSELGSKSVHSGITYDEETESMIVVDTDVSAMRHMYDGELHSLKNLIKEAKELTGQLVLCDSQLEIGEAARAILQHNNHTLEKALLFYENRRYVLGGGYPHADRIAYDLEIGLENILQWMESLLVPLQIQMEINVQGLEIQGHIQAIELIFHNAVFNAIQAIRDREPRPETPYIRITAQRETNGVLVEIADNGKPLPAHFQMPDAQTAPRGMGLSIVLWQMKALGGACRGLEQRENGEKGLYLFFPG
jgi:PAS domain-containing protein